MRIVIISGGSSGIGAATVQRFAEQGDQVFNFDVQPPAGPAPAQAVWKKVDVADWGAVTAAVGEVVDERGGLDVAIANAGISVRHGVLELTEETARRVIDVNLFGVMALWVAAAAPMTAAGHGRLLATASVNGQRGYPNYADYNATKAGIISLTQTFALELSPVVQVNCVSPGAVLTPMQLAEYTDEMLADTNARIPARRHAMPPEIAAAFHYLASEEAAFITGQDLVIDGGEVAGATTSAFGSGGRA